MASYPTLADLTRTINGMITNTGQMLDAGVKMRNSLVASVGGMHKLADETMLLNRGLSTQIGFNEKLIETYVGLAAKSLVFEARNKDLNKTFGITSKSAALVSQTIHTLAKEHGFAGAQAIGYANSIKKLLPTYQQQGKENDKTYKSMQRIQHVLTTNLGLTEESTTKYTLYASKNGENADTTLAFAAALADTLEDTDGTMGYMKMAIEGIAEASETTQLQFGKIPGNLEIATIRAKTLGFELDDLAESGNHLLDIESSIGQELEYQLLSGRRLVGDSKASAELQGKSLTNAYREATLRGNMSDAASVLNTILEQEGDVLEDNLFARKQMADLMGMDEASLSRALQKKKLLSSQPNLNILMNLNGTELQKTAQQMLKNGEMTQDTFDKISESNDTRTTDDIMKQQLNVAVESLATLSAMLTTTQSTNVEKQRAALTDAGLGEFKTALLDFTETDMKGAGGNEYLPDMLTNAKAVLKQIPAGKVDSYESEATSAKPITTNNDAVIPAGYGDRILTFPEDTLQADVEFKNNDTIVAGTSLAGNNSSTTSTGATGNNSSTSPGGATDNVLLAVGRMIVAAINSKGSNLFAATTMNDSTYQT
jgi:hypothetical protein